MEKICNSQQQQQGEAKATDDQSQEEQLFASSPPIAAPPQAFSPSLNLSLSSRKLTDKNFLVWNQFSLRVLRNNADAAGNAMQLRATHHLPADPSLLQEPCEKFSVDQIFMGNGSDQILLRGTLTSDGLYAFYDIRLLNLAKFFSPTVIRNVYVFPIHSDDAVSSLPRTYSSTSTVSNNNCSSYFLCHYRLGHTHERIVTHVVHQCNFSHTKIELKVQYC
ncbi:hypothetical protein Lal_00028317 [Lupinus albus]|nr:hypothetical protein Lal_00028317 [Lupinus albus]